MEEEIAINRLIGENEALKIKAHGLPDVGKRCNNKRFYSNVANVEKAIRIFYNEIREIDKYVDKTIPKNSLGGGSPAKFAPFPLSIREINKVLNNSNIYEYPLSAGNEEYRKKVLEYLESEGFKNNKPYNIMEKSKSGLNIDNIIFTVSTTHAYTLILSVITRQEDVIIMTGPNYGLFVFEPERLNGRVEIIDLEESDDWYINPQKLARKIDEVNDQLKKKYKGNSYIPRVKAFLNTNPHNPLGKVMNSKHYERLKTLSEECKKRGVFIIDDMVYRDLSYDRDDMAVPIATIPNMFSNTITLLGLSKSYGLAGIRAGMIVADEVIIRGVRNKMFQQMDSPPIIQGAALAGAFNKTLERKKIYKKYFDKVIPEYKYRYEIIKAMVDGIESISDYKVRKMIEKDVKKEIKGEDELKFVFEGIPGVKFVNKTEPESSFFSVLDFTELKGKKYKEYTISNEIELLKFYYKYFRVKFFIGKSISWPDKEKLIVRVTYALERTEIIRAFYCINKGARLLK